MVSGTRKVTPGCSHVSDDCVHCTAVVVINRHRTNPKTPNDHGGFRKVASLPDALAEPKSRESPELVMVSPLSDLFHPDVTDDFIEKVFGTMGDTPQHTYHILTKRPERLSQLKNLKWHDNIVMGVSAGRREG